MRQVQETRQRKVKSQIGMCNNFPIYMKMIWKMIRRGLGHGQSKCIC
jgi:hypothetical protein